ncbi:MAG: LuxR C-terminal-related transcriptional regulator [Pseudomonadota bacterium]
MNTEDNGPRQLIDGAPVSVDFRVAFERAPVGMLILREQTIVATNRALCTMFGIAADALIGARFGVLFHNNGALDELYSAMTKAVCHVGEYHGHLLARRCDAAVGDPALLGQVNVQYLSLDNAHRLLICSMSNLSQVAQDCSDLTPRERDVALLLRKRHTAKEIGKCLGISHRTVEVHRSKLMRKYGVHTVAELSQQLLHEPLDASSLGTQASDATHPKAKPLTTRSDTLGGPIPNRFHTSQLGFSHGLPLPASRLYAAL